MSTVYSKQLLSASAGGRQILLTGTTAPGTVLHTTTGTALNAFDEIWLYASNNGIATATLSTLWGGTLSSDLLVTTLPGTQSRILIADGKVLQAGQVSAYVSAGTVAIDGFVNRIQPDIDPRIGDWALRVVRNGGAFPSIATQQALSVFVQTLTATGVLPKIISMIPLVPDSVIAATTPLIPGPTFDPWTNNGFVSGDLNINGMVGNGSSKYLNTGVIPANTAMTSIDAGLTAYVYDNSASASGYPIGCGGSANSSQFSLYPSDTSVADAFCWRFVNVGTDWISVSKPQSGGYFSFSRTASNKMDFYFGNSLAGHVNTGSASGAQTGAIINDQPIYAFVLNANGSPASYSVDRISFLAMHTGLSATDSFNFFSAIQTLRIALGGGYV